MLNAFPAFQFNRLAAFFADRPKCDTLGLVDGQKNRHKSP